jgi:hypothetical protein
MDCEHFWLPSHTLLWRSVTCAHCSQIRRVRLQWLHPVPATNGEALGEAIDRGVLDNDEVTWGGRRLR